MELLSLKREGVKGVCSPSGEGAKDLLFLRERGRIEATLVRIVSLRTGRIIRGWLKDGSKSNAVQHTL